MLVTIGTKRVKILTRYKEKVVSAAMLESKSMPSHMAANINTTTLLFKNSNCLKISPLNVFPLKFRV